jgi:hypothetical protein
MSSMNVKKTILRDGLVEPKRVSVVLQLVIREVHFKNSSKNPGTSSF